MQWREDLLANANRHGFTGFIIGWFMNPGFAVATLYRLAHWGHHKAGALGKLISVFAWRRIVKGYGCYIDPKAVIGPGVRFPHPVSIVIGEATVIGAHATIYQNVTFGRRTADDDHYPVLGDHVTVYTGASIIGGVHVGDNAVLGAHALVKANVPAGGLAKGVFAQVKAR